MTQLRDEQMRSRLRAIAAQGTLMTSVTGSLVYADAGLLDGRPATTHWSALDDLTALGLVGRLRSRERARNVRRHIQYDLELPV
jgi:putative intracellular protease/amidase